MTALIAARPPQVFTGAYLFSGASVLWLTAGLATFFAIPEYSRHYADLEQDPVSGTVASVLLVMVALTAMAGAGLALLLSLLGWAGRPTARTLINVLSGIAVAVAAALLLLDPFSAIPWHRWLMAGVAALTLILVVACGVLLSLPTSRTWFRQARAVRPARQWSLAARNPGYPQTPPYRHTPAGNPPHGLPLSMAATVPPPVPAASSTEHRSGRPAGQGQDHEAAPTSPAGFPVPASSYSVPAPGYQPSPPPPLQQPRRPVAVTIAMVVLLCTAILALGAAGVEILRYRAILDWLDTYQRTIEQQAAPYGIQVDFPELPRAAAGPTVIVVVALVAIAAALVGLAVAIRLPRPWARIAALVVVGLLAPLAAGWAMVTLTTQATMHQLDENSRRLHEGMGVPYQGLAPRVSEIYPSWAYYSVYLTSGLALAGCLAVFILLLLRNSAVWFAMTTPLRTPAPLPRAEARFFQTPTLAPDGPEPVIHPALTVITSPRALPIVRELLLGSRFLSELAAGPLGADLENLQGQLRQLCAAGVVREFTSPNTTSVSYELTDLGQHLRPLLRAPHHPPTVVDAPSPPTSGD